MASAADIAPGGVPARGGRRSWLVVGVVLLAMVWPRHAWDHYHNFNETARICLVQAIVDEGVLNIDHGIAAYGEIHDRAVYEGRSYCDKPIGLSLAGVPVYAVMKAVGRVIGREWSLTDIRYWLAVFCVSLPTAAMLLWLRRYWAEIAKDELLADFTVLAYGLGTIAYTYSTQFMGHQAAAVLAVAHFALSRRMDRESGPWRVAAAGLLTGFGAITEYYSLFIHLIIAASYVRRLYTGRLWLAWLGFAALGFAPLPAYNLICFGGPLRMAYSQEAVELFREQHATGFLGVTYPRLESITGLLLSPSKGLFYINPALLLALAAYFPPLNKGRARVGFSTGEHRREWVVAAFSTVAIVLLAMSVLGWRAGWTVGPRHMVSMLPFMITLVVAGIARWPGFRAWWVMLSCLGMVFVGVATLTLPAFEMNFENPIATQAFFLAGLGFYSPNVGAALGLSGFWSVAPLIVAAVAVLSILLITAIRRRTRIVSANSFIAAAVSITGLILVVNYEPDHPALRQLLQGRVLGMIDRLAEAAPRLEKAIELHPDRMVLDQAAPHLMSIYQELGDSAAQQRLTRRVEEIQRQSTP